MMYLPLVQCNPNTDILSTALPLCRNSSWQSFTLSLKAQNQQLFFTSLELPTFPPAATLLSFECIASSCSPCLNSLGLPVLPLNTSPGPSEPPAQLHQRIKPGLGPFSMESREMWVKHDQIADWICLQFLATALCYRWTAQGIFYL